MDDLQKWFLEHASDEAADKSFEKLISDYETDDYELSSEGFRRFRERIQREKESSWKHDFFRVAERVAAILLLPVIITATIFAFRHPAPVEWTEVYTAAGQTMTVSLSDGSTVRLAPESHMLYPSSFSRDHRQVFLQGEVYADITHMESCPFEICSGDIKVTVLGTEFNFSSYKSDDECELALVDGAVELMIEGENSNQSIRMKTGDVVRYERSSGLVNKERFCVDSFLENSRIGGLQFYNRKLADIAHSLERKFGTRIIIEDDEIAEERFFASFINGEDLETILESFNTQHYMIIRNKDNAYYLSLKK